MNKIKWIAFQPLIGGAALGAERAIGNKPEYILSYPCIANDAHLVKYWNYEDKYFIISEETEPKEYTDIDLVIGCPRCAGLSLLNACNDKNSCKSRGADAVQNENMKNMTEYTLGTIKPKVFLFENAPALYTKMGEDVRNFLIESAKKYGYSVSFVKTDTELHGIPQFRKRTFAFFWKSETAPIVNWYKKERKNVTEYLKEIPKDSVHYDVYFFDLSKDFFFDYIKQKLGDNFRETLKKEKCKSVLTYVTKFDLIDDMREYAKSIDNKLGVKTADHMQKKYAAGLGIWDASIRVFDEVFNAVVSRNVCSVIHPIEDRPINGREFLWLMGHPHDFEVINIKRNWNMIAQNVCVDVAEDWTKECLKFLKGELKDSGSPLVMQNNIKEKIDFINKNPISFF